MVVPPNSALLAEWSEFLTSGPPPFAYHSKTIRSLRITMNAVVALSPATMLARVRWQAAVSVLPHMPWFSGVSACQPKADAAGPGAAPARSSPASNAVVQACDERGRVDRGTVRSPGCRFGCRADRPRAARRAAPQSTDGRVRSPCRHPGPHVRCTTMRREGGTMGTYRQIYERSLEQPEAFWAEAAEALHWDRRWDRVLDADKAPFYRWFAGGVLNTCFNAVDRHVAAGRGGQPAIIHDSPVTGTKRVITYAELRDQVARFAGALVRLGVRKGDRVIVYMPMVPEALVAMLACARIGAVHSVVFGGFASPELATRIDDAKPKVVVSASCGIEGPRCIPYKPLLDKALDLASHEVAHCVVLQRPQATAELRPGRDLDWHEAVAAAHPVDCVPVAATDPLYILYTSGTTGQPKGVVRDNGGHAVATLWTMRNLYGVEPGEVFWSASDVGWVVGHSYIVYGPLLNGNTTIVYEGKPVGTPDPGAFWRVASEYKVAALFTAPTAFRAIRKEDPEGDHIRRYDLSRLRALFLAGERCDPDTLLWAEAQLGVPVIDH